jgi:hypothetical protein
MAEPENSYPIDPENAGELARLMQQDRLLTEGMGGCCPNQGSGCRSGGECWIWRVGQEDGP